MPLTSYQLILYIVLLMSTLLSASSSSWFMVWVGMEMNTIVFVPLITQPAKLSSESALKYFLIQAISSILFFFSSLQMYYSNTPTPPAIPLTLMGLALLMKLGAAPMHFWLPQIVEGLSWNSTTIILTWQKIIPLMIIIDIPNTPLIYASGVISALIGTIGGLNQLSLKKLLAYSSISHMGWLLSASILSPTLTLMYFIVYLVTATNMILIAASHNSTQLTQTATLKNNNALFMLCLFSLGGLPPFLGFMPKWMTLNLLISYSYIFLSATLLACAVVTLVYYLRIIYTTMLMNSLSSKWVINNMKISPTLIILTTFNLCSSPLWMFMY